MSDSSKLNSTIDRYIKQIEEFKPNTEMCISAGVTRSQWDSVITILVEHLKEINGPVVFSRVELMHLAKQPEILHQLAIFHDKLQEQVESMGIFGDSIRAAKLRNAAKLLEDKD